MSQIRATLVELTENKPLHILKFKLNKQTITLLSLELPPNISLNNSYTLQIKPTDIAISKQYNNEISISNQLNATILDIECSKLLCSITLDIEGVKIESIILKASLQQMSLQTGEALVVLIPATKVSIC